MTDAKIKHITTPLTAETIKELHAGDVVRITGSVYTARDAAHKRMTEAMRPGEVIGSAGPTTSGRMDKYTPALIAEGMRGMIGKGLRGKEVVEACVKYGAVYFVAVGGAAAVISQSIKGEEMIAYEDLGPEAIRRYEVEDFPAIVCIDAEGNDFYKVGIAKYSKE